MIYLLTATVVTVASTLVLYATKLSNSSQDEELEYEEINIYSD